MRKGTCEFCELDSAGNHEAGCPERQEDERRRLYFKIREAADKAGLGWFKEEIEEI